MLNKQIASLRVPFGLKQGRMWSPRQVSTGLACECICPGCRALLVARNAGQERRAHFAHFQHQDCSKGVESAIHLMAKQVLLDRAQLMVPPWDGSEEMPNPPTLHDANGVVHRGCPIERPAELRELSQVRAEVSFGDYRPDIVAQDKHGELLIEIRVTHKVGEEKYRNVQSEGRRMLEIDLSGLSVADVEDADRFESLVLNSAENRQWLSQPEAADAWRGSLASLKEQVRLRNVEIAAEQAARDALVEQQIRAQREREEQKARSMATRRAPHELALAQLIDTTSGGGIGREMERMRARDEAKARELLARVSNDHARLQLEQWDQHAWAYQSHPMLWQTAAYLHFIESRPPGHVFPQPDLARWVRATFGVRDPIWQLFYAQYQCQLDSRKRGRPQRLPWAWFFTHEENRRIPNVWEPINKLVERLRLKGIVAHDGQRYERLVVL